MYSETYQLGLDRNILTDRNRIRFFDIDGVLSTYAYGADGINAVSDQEFDQFVEHVDLYQKAEGSLLLREYLETYTDPALNYVVSQSGSITQDDQKRHFLSRVYHGYFPEDHIFFSRTSEKAPVMKSILLPMQKALQTPHLAIDDDVRVLDLLQKEGITAVHVSSLMLLADLSYRK